jgi:hypothetical protein
MMARNSDEETLGNGIEEGRNGSAHNDGPADGERGPRRRNLKNKGVGFWHS